MPKLQFWYDHASNYSYLSAMRIEQLAAGAGVEVEWKPFLLGPIFKAQGWTTSPFNLYPAKGRNMLRDMERLTADRGLAFVMPGTFPANSLLAGRLALAGESEGWTAAFSRAVFEAEFGRGEDISATALMAEILTQIGVDAGQALQRAEQPEIKLGLRERTEDAQRRGIFGAPTFITDAGELFWGDDRLEQALAWAASDLPQNG